jgi:hypothetical protein
MVIYIFSIFYFIPRSSWERRGSEKNYSFQTSLQNKSFQTKKQTISFGDPKKIELFSGNGSRI